MAYDDAFLKWPFFDEAHASRYRQLRAWAESTTPAEVSPEAEDVDKVVREWVGALGEAGWLQACVAADGKLDVRALCLSRDALASVDGLADFAFAMQGLGTGAISLFGTPGQKERWLPGVAAGQAIAAFALSEAKAGSDVGSLAVSATPDGDGWVLDGEKTWISNGPIADVFTVVARTGEGERTRGLTAFVVAGDTPGLAVAERLETMAPHPLATIRFDGCHVGPDALIGEPGQGFAVAMATLDTFRPTVGAAALGFARRALHETIAHTTQRQLFGAPLSAMQLTQSAIATMATEIDASALLVYRAAWLTGRRTTEAAMAKWYATEAAQRVIDAAVQLHGGRGVLRGEVVERLYREIRALRIYEGASEVQQQVIARQILKGGSG